MLQYHPDKLKKLVVKKIKDINIIFRKVTEMKESYDAVPHEKGDDDEKLMIKVLVLKIMLRKMMWNQELLQQIMPQEKEIIKNIKHSHQHIMINKNPIMPIREPSFILTLMKILLRVTRKINHLMKKI